MRTSRPLRRAHAPLRRGTKRRGPPCTARHPTGERPRDSGGRARLVHTGRPGDGTRDRHRRSGAGKCRDGADPCAPCGPETFAPRWAMELAQDRAETRRNDERSVGTTSAVRSGTARPRRTRRTGHAMIRAATDPGHRHLYSHKRTRLCHKLSAVEPSLALSRTLPFKIRLIPTR